MRIKFLKNTNIRDSLPENGGKIIGVIYRDVELDVEAKIDSSELFQGTRTWFRDGRGWYYWSGGAALIHNGDEVARIAEPVAAAAPVGTTQQILLSDRIPPVVEETVVEDAQDLKLLDLIPADAGVVVVSPVEEKEAAAVEEAQVLNESPELPHIEAPEADVFLPLSFDPLWMPWAVRDLQIERLWRDFRLSGKNVGVALLDTGMDEQHPDLKDIVLARRNFCGPDAEDIRDEDGRGTRMAGLIAAQGNALVSGIAPSARLFVARIMRNTFDISFDRLVQGLEWAIQMPVDLILIGMDMKPSSLTEEQRQTLTRMIDSITERGILVIAPAGQSSLLKPEDRLPACLDNCLSVGAADRQGSRYRHSLRSNTLDVLAPGVDLLTTASGTGTDTAFSGSDAAAAVTAGAMALIAEYIHDHNVELTIPELLSAIRETAIRDIRESGRTVEQGFGRFNLAGLLESLAGKN